MRPRSSVVEREIPALRCILKAIRSIRVGVNLFKNFDHLASSLYILTVTVRKMVLGCHCRVGISLTTPVYFQDKAHSSPHE